MFIIFVIAAINAKGGGFAAAAAAYGQVQPLVGIGPGDLAQTDLTDRNTQLFAGGVIAILVILIVIGAVY